MNVILRDPLLETRRNITILSFNLKSLKIVKFLSSIQHYSSLFSYLVQLWFQEVGECKDGGKIPVTQYFSKVKNLAQRLKKKP